MAMNFRRRAGHQEPEINLIAFIDILLVVLIFLMLTTTYAKVSELKINLPTANAKAAANKPAQITVMVASDGRYMVNQRMLSGRGVETLASALTQAAAGKPDNVIVINADAAASHQSVINVMDAARRAGLTQLTFATQSQQSSMPAADI